MGHKQSSPLPRAAYTKSRVTLIWVNRNSAVLGRLSANILREVCQYIGAPPLLASAGKTHLTILDPISRRVSKIQYDKIGLSINYRTEPMCVCVDGDQVFLCGGETGTQYKNCAVSTTITISYTQAKQLSDMQKARSLHGLYYYEAGRQVFVFGGLTPDGRMDTCEQYDFARDTWSLLPNMKREKTRVEVCGYRGKVFLAGILQAIIEVFTIATKEFVALPLQMDPVTNPPNGFCVMLIWKDQLIIAQGEQKPSVPQMLRRWNANTYTLISETAINSDIQPRCAKVVHDTLWILESLRYATFDIETFEVGEMQTLSK